MKKNTKEVSYEIFISHSFLDRNLAIELKNCISSCLGLNKRRIYCSSDSTSINMVTPTLDQITLGHKKSKAVVVLMTPNSIYRSWVWFEAGGAYFHNMKPLIIVTANGITLECLPKPLDSLPFFDLSDYRNLRKVGKTLFDTLKNNFKERGIKLELKPINKKDVRRIVKLASTRLGDWKSVNQIITASALAESPFNVLRLMDKHHSYCAKKEICLIGQHLYGLSQVDGSFGDCKKKIFKWLREDKKRKFSVMITFIKSPHGVGAWKLILGDKFINNLQESTERLKKWEIEAKRKRLGFNIKYADFVPIGATFVDAEEDKGLMILRPFFSAAEPANRPEFILVREQNKRVFDYYWHSFRQIFANAHSSS